MVAWSSGASPHLTPSRVVLYTIGLGVTLAGLRVTLRLVRLFSHREEVLPWLHSVVPPMDYDYKKDVEPKAYVEERFPTLADIAGDGTLCVLRPPHDFDRALPEELYVLGTAHVSKRTAEACYRTIVEVEPDACIVELCKSRSFMLYREVPPSMWAVAEPEPAKAPTTAAAATPTSEVAQADPQQQPQSATARTPLQDRTEEQAAGRPSAPSAPQQQQEAPAAEEPTLASQLSSLVQALRTHSSPLQALLSWAYAKVELQLKTVAGLEFIRVWHAIQEVERRRKARALAAQQQQHLQQQQQRQPAGEITAATPPTSEGGGGQVPAVGAAPAPVQYASVQVYLGDVPLQRTISRIWGVLSVRQKLKLCWTLVRDCLTLQADDGMLEQLLEEDMLELMQKELGSEFPEILGPLLHERNWQLANTVHTAAQHGMRRVVLVIGRGHVPGVIYCLMQPYRARKSMRLPSADLAHLVGGEPTAANAAL